MGLLKRCLVSKQLILLKIIILYDIHTSKFTFFGPRFKCSWAHYKKTSLAIVGVWSFGRYLKGRLGGRTLLQG
jgi:hypothetical protein